MKVMVVTQQDDVKRMHDEVLAGSSDEVLGATDLATGLALSAEHSPEVAIIDISLAGGAALAMVHHVVASSPRTAIYILSPATMFEIAGEALSLGAAGLIVAPATGDAILRCIAEVRSRVGNEERVAKLTAEARDAAELVDAMTQALLVAKTGDLRALGETLLPLFLIASGAHGVAVYGEEDGDGTRKRIAAFGTALELLDRYNDLELAQMASSRHAEVIGLALAAQMYGCVLLEHPNPARSARVHRVVEFTTALMPVCAMARVSLAEDNTAPRSRALPRHVFEGLVQRDVDAAREGAEVTLLCALGRGGEMDTGPLGPALALSGAAIGMGETGEAYVLLPKTPFAVARGLLLDMPLAVGIASAPADGKRAIDLLALAHARAKRSARAFPGTRELRNRSLGEVITALTTTSYPTLTRIDVNREAVESMVLHACRHARAVSSAEVIVAHGGEANTVVSTVKAAGPRTKVRDIAIADTSLAGALIVVVLTARAGWGLVVGVGRGVAGGEAPRGGEGPRAVHTCDALVLELLRAHLTGAA